MMSTEDLLKPRYKVIGRYPDSPFEVGDILQEDKIWQVSEPDTLVDYPLIFRKLEWWEDRKPGELKEAVPFIKSKSTGDVYKVNYYKFNDFDEGLALDINVKWRVLNDMIPATESEYTNPTNK